jgi:hypothetical protein
MRSILFASTSLVPVMAAATDTGSEKTIDKVVYIKAADSLKVVVANIGNAADATLRMTASMVVHLVVRTYSPIEADRASYDDTKAEIVTAFKEYGEAKRGKEFGKAWVYRFLSVATNMARSLVKDYDKKGVQDGSPLSMILRAKTADKACDIVFDFIMKKTKGANAFAALEKQLAPKPPAKPQGETKASNNVKASTDKPSRIAAAMVADKGSDIFNAVPGNAKAKAIKIADKVGQSNVDHLAFVLRSIGFLSSVDDLMAVAQAATDRAKELQASANVRKEQAKATRKRNQKAFPSDGGAASNEPAAAKAV